MCIHEREREKGGRELAASLSVMEDTLTSFEPFLFFFMSTQPSMNTLGEQLATMACVLVVDVIIQ